MKPGVGDLPVPKKMFHISFSIVFWFKQGGCLNTRKLVANTLWNFVIGLTFGATNPVSTSPSNRDSDKPEKGYVPDEQTAISIAVAVLIRFTVREGPLEWCLELVVHVEVAECKMRPN